ncbi:MAG: hypothetical protein ACJ8AW_20500 [Rhodopila sp.]
MDQGRGGGEANRRSLLTRRQAEPPNLTAAFDEARTKISDSDFLKLILPLKPKLSIPVSHGSTVFDLIAQNAHLLPIRF